MICLRLLPAHPKIRRVKGDTIGKSIKFPAIYAANVQNPAECVPANRIMKGLTCGRARVARGKLR